METYIAVGIIVILIGGLYFVRSKRAKVAKFEGGVGRGQNGPGDI